MSAIECPKCSATAAVKAGIINNRQRYKCKSCAYHFTVNKIGKQINSYYVVKALQLYVEGVSYREIERILGVSHVSVMNWVKQYKVTRPLNHQYHPTYKIVNRQELLDFMSIPNNTMEKGMIVTELGDKFMLIVWERFKE